MGGLGFDLFWYSSLFSDITQMEWQRKTRKSEVASFIHSFIQLEKGKLILFDTDSFSLTILHDKTMSKCG